MALLGGLGWSDVKRGGPTSDPLLFPVEERRPRNAESDCEDGGAELDQQSRDENA